MSYSPDKAIPLAVSTLEEVTKMIKKKDEKANDNALEKIFMTIFSDEDVVAEDVDEMFFRLHAACRTTLLLKKSNGFHEKQMQDLMAKEFDYHETASELGVSYDQVKKLVRLGKLNVKKYSRRTVRITYGEIEKYRREEQV